MSLYQNSVLEYYLNKQDVNLLDKKYKVFCDYFHDATIQKNIRDSKEEQFQEGFLRELFVKVLGYCINPSPDYNLTTEFKNQKGAKKADGAILDSTGEAIGVIELKGTNTKDLERVRQQAFDYKANQRKCIYVITSNFEKLRFYIENAVDYIEFNLFNLEREEFYLLYLCLASDNISNQIPFNIKKESLQKEISITKKLYSEYSEFKSRLYDDLVINNLEGNLELIDSLESPLCITELKQLLYKKSQKLIDRFLFMFFAEDRYLLPPNTTINLIKEWEQLVDLDEYTPLYSRIKKYFNYLDKGRKATLKQAEIFAYNGGLFRKDSVLDSLLISDETLKKYLLRLSAYDFNTQVDTNILGHIFENSISDIEEVNASIEGKVLTTNKRKKEGVFYTPDYVTKFLCDDAIGQLCSRKKQDLGIFEDDYRPNRIKKTKQELFQKLQIYRKWLLELKILDPSCGSGAFLNQALLFLIKEHEYIDELESKLTGSSIVFANIENTILEKNLYGVDINEESVEISRLSLWLRTAKPGRKLNDLSNNIKSGNSLIESRDIAPYDAFNWKESFPEVFDKGGFDVIIGNPPWGAVLSEEEKSYVKNIHKDIIVRMTDSFMFFIDLSIGLLADSGYLSLVVPDVFLYQKDNFKLRKKLLSTMTLKTVINMGEGVFENVNRPSCIFTANKKKDDLDTFTRVGNFNVRLHTDLYSVPMESVPCNLFDGVPDSIIATKELDGYQILNRLKGSCLSDVIDDDGISRGVSPDLKDAFITSSNIISKEGFETSVIHKTITGGKDLVSFFIKPVDKHIFYVTKETDPKSIPRIIDYIETYRDRITCKEVSSGKHPIFTLHRPRKESIFQKPSKVIGVITGDRIITCVDTETHYPTDGLYLFSPKSSISSKAVSTILNTKLVTYLYRLLSAENGRPMSQVKPVILSKLPFVHISQEDVLKLEGIYDYVSNLKSKKDQLIKSVQRYIQSYYKLDDLGKLREWQRLGIDVFINELERLLRKHGGSKLEIKERIQWEEYLIEERKHLERINGIIDSKLQESEDLTCVLYGLSDKEKLRVYKSN